MITNEKAMLLGIRLEFPVFDGALRTAANTCRHFAFLEPMETEITPGYGIGQQLRKDRAEGTGITAAFTGNASQIIPLKNTILLLFKSIGGAALDTGSFVAVTAGGSEFRQFAQIHYPIIKGMVKISARDLTLAALATFFQINE